MNEKKGLQSFEPFEVLPLYTLGYLYKYLQQYLMHAVETRVLAIIFIIMTIPFWSQIVLSKYGYGTKAFGVT